MAKKPKNKRWQNFEWGEEPNYGELGPEDNVTANEFAHLRREEMQGGTTLANSLAGQQRAYDAYASMAVGNGPSVAETQQQAGLSRAIASQQGMAAQASGGNLAGQMRQAQAAGAGMQMQGIQDAAMLRAQEQQQAMAGMAGTANAMGSQGLQQQLGYAGLGQDARQSQLDAQMQWQQLQLEAQKFRHERASNWANFGVEGAGKVIGSILGAVVSDERAKDEIEPTNLSASYAVGTLKPKEFSYKPGYGPYGRKIGFSAQDVQASPLGQQLVIDTPQGKMIDTQNAAMVGLAATAEQEQRLRALEAKSGMPQTVQPTQGLAQYANIPRTAPREIVVVPVGADGIDHAAEAADVAPFLRRRERDERPRGLTQIAKSDAKKEKKGDSGGTGLLSSLFGGGSGGGSGGEGGYQGAKFGGFTGFGGG